MTIPGLYLPGSWPQVCLVALIGAVGFRSAPGIPIVLLQAELVGPALSVAAGNRLRHRHG